MSSEFGITYASNVSGYPFGYPDTLVGVPPNPGPDVFTSGRTRLTAWLFRSLWSLLPARPRRKSGARFAPVRVAPGTAQDPIQ